MADKDGEIIGFMVLGDKGFAFESIGDRSDVNMQQDQKRRGDSWTVSYHANNGDVYQRHDVVYYEIQEALMDLSREAYENNTEAKYITMY